MIQELALTEIDDSADPNKNFTIEETDLLGSIGHNISIWEDELERKEYFEVHTLSKDNLNTLDSQGQMQNVKLSLLNN